MASRNLLFQSRRFLSSTGRFGTIKPRAKPAPLPKTHPKPENEEVVAIISPEIRTKNVALGTFLVAFCFGVAWYSRNAVGQAGGDADDPLAALKEEAAAAQEKHDRENQSTDKATEMLKQFQSGEYDPDKYDELEEEEEKPTKRPWWKLW